jgi:PAS domain S-box-containing protein
MKARFQIGLAGILILFCLFAAAITYFYERNFYEHQVRAKTDLVMDMVEATRGYIRETLRPEMYARLGEDAFVLEAMSTSYITRVIMERFNTMLPEFIYRRTAVNARNPAFEAKDYEQKMINYFKKHPDEEYWFGITRMGGERRFVQFRPIRFSRSCLHCHGRVEDAPASVIERYGTERGFGRQAGMIGGVQSISFAADSQMAAMRASAFQVFSLIVVVVLFLYAVIWIFFDWTVARSIRNVLGLFRNSLQDREGEKIFQSAVRGDEVKKLEHSARQMADHLARTRAELEEYTRRLENMVAEQTRDLRNSQARLREQVSARNRELHLLNNISGLITRSTDRHHLLQAVLAQALRVVPARGGGIYLPGATDFTLCCSLQADELTDRLPMAVIDRDENESGDDLILPGCSYIGGTDPDGAGIRVPLCCREQLQGILVFTGIRLDTLDEAMRELLLSIGQQIGITLENLKSIDDLRRSKELLQTVFDAITDPMVMVNGAGEILMVNAAFLSRYHVTEDEVGGGNLARLSEGKKLPYAHCFPVRDTPRQKDVRLADGSEFTVISYPVTLQGDRSGGLVCFARDITGRKEVERRIRRTERLAALGQLAAGVAHEINNPLGVILCYAEILRQEEGLPQSGRSDIEVITRQAENCRRIVSDLLNFSRGHEFDGSLTRITDILAEVHRLFERRFAERGIRFTCRESGDIPPCFMDRARIQQVFVNLIMNSLQAVGEGGRITVVVELAEEGLLVIRVEDNGCGIEPEVQPRIFDPFFTTKDRQQGTGLGLSVSIGIVREHGGTITVSSTPGRGSCFTVTLPLEGLATG